jgi:hypothetical protein
LFSLSLLTSLNCSAWRETSPTSIFLQSVSGKYTSHFNITPVSFFSFPWFHSPAYALASSTKSGWISWRLLNSFLFYRVGLLAPRPIPEDQASVFISPRGRVATHFSRLLRHAWVTVGLFLLPSHHTGNTVSSSLLLLSNCVFKL